MDELGQLLTPQAQPQLTAPNPQLKAEWDGWLQNPVNRAGMLSFGLQLMAGGWGGPAAQFASAAGAGLEAAGGTQKLLDAETQTAQARSDKIADREDEQAFKREQQSADNAAAMARTKAGAASSRQDAIYASLVKAAEDKSLKLSSKIAEVRADIMMDDATKSQTIAELETQLQRFSDPVGYAESVLARRGSGGDAISATETSEIKAPVSGSVGPAGATQPAATSQRQAPPLTDNKGAQNTTVPSTMTSEQYLAKFGQAGIEKAKANPKALAKLKEKVPDWYKLPGLQSAPPVSGFAPRGAPAASPGTNWLLRNIQE